MTEVVEISHGRDALWSWFGCSRASFITIPRIMAHDMPDDWQQKMCDLLEEYDATFINQPNLGTRVQCTKGGRLCKWPYWILDYRHPDRVELHKLKEKRNV